MTITIWMVLLIICLVLEFVRMNLYGACGAAGALGGLIAAAFGLAVYFQIPIAIIIAVGLVVAVRPIGLKYVNRMKKDSKMLNLVGRDAIVVATINSMQGTGMITINGRSYAAKSHRPNAVIEKGTLVKVVAMNKDVAIVDDKKRNYS